MGPELERTTDPYRPGEVNTPGGGHAEQTPQEETPVPAQQTEGVEPPEPPEDKDPDSIDTSKYAGKDNLNTSFEMPEVGDPASQDLPDVGDNRK